MTEREALQALAVEARVRAKYFSARAGRRVDDSHCRTVPLQAPLERLRAEKRALAFLAAAERIERELAK